MRRSVLYFVLLLPLLTSAVVRTFGWMILLGNNGFINRTLIALGIVDDPVRMMYSMTGIVIALVEVLLPFMVLALDAALLNIDPHLYEAAQNLGARKRSRLPSGSRCRSCCPGSSPAACSCSPWR